MEKAVRRRSLLVAALSVVCGVGRAAAQEAEVDRLVKLAASGGSKGFGALLKLRDVADERALPLLADTLKRHHGSGNIFQFAAAQALFCIGTPGAHELLREHLLTSKYNAELGIRYAFYHKMPEAKRHAFIEQYHLVSSSRDLALKIEAQPDKAAVGQPIAFTVTLTNASRKPLRVHKPGVYLANLLVIRSAAGHFVLKRETAEYGYHIGERDFPELGPGNQLRVAFAATPRQRPALWHGFRAVRVPDQGALTLESRDTAHHLGKPGKFKVYGFYNVSHRFAQGQAQRLGLPPVWSGRVVSEPIELDILPAAREQRPAGVRP